MARTDAEQLQDAIGDMGWWLTAMLTPPADGETDPDPYRHLDDDELEFGERVADELLAEHAHRSVDGLSAVLRVRGPVELRA